MIGAHITQTIDPALIDKYLEWRQREGELAKRTPGFIKRSMTRDLEQPNVFYYVTFWESKEHIDAFTAQPEFKQLVAETGIGEVMASSTTVRNWVSEVFDDAVAG